ncbi:cadherin repeat domain-containing protein, partial [bacterium c-19]|nr:cadherin repeat domain-containing protein [bacterium c-19]
FFSVDANTGVIKTTANLGVNSYHITVTVSDNWSTKEIPVTINVGVAAAEDLRFYETTAAINAITTKSVKVTDTGVIVFATVKGSSNTNPVKYKIKDGSTNVIEVNENSGAITIHGVGTVIIVAEKQGATGQGDAQAELTFTVTAGSQEFIYTDEAGNELPKQTDKYKAYEEVYEKDKTFQLYTAGNPIGSTVTYQLKNGSPTDVISVDSDGVVHILNASLNTQMGKVIVEATSHDPTGNYADKTIELPINIKKANQTISFADVTYVTNGKGKVTPVITEQDISSNDGGVTVNDTDYYITVDTSVSPSTAWTNDGVEIEYDYSGETGIDIPLHVEKQGNRNYNKAEADGMMHIMGPDENMLAISSPGKIIYGDHFTIRSLQDDSSSTDVQYTFEVDNTTYISTPTVTGNKAEFDALKYSGTTTIKIKVTRTANGETPLSKTITVKVLPKPIEIKIDDKEKYKGEQNPTLTYQD